MEGSIRPTDGNKSFESSTVAAALATPDGTTVVRSDTRVLLLVEDHPGEALLVREMLSDPGEERFEIVHARSLAEARTTLRLAAVDVVLLDLRLPDCAGVETVLEVKRISGRTPIVVLTGSDDEQLAMACINAGAQDYLAKSEIRPQALRRAIGYAVTRVREAQLRELERMLEGYRALSSSAQRTRVTAALAGTGAISERSPGAFDLLVASYQRLVERIAFGPTDEFDRRDEMERVVTALGDADGGPRDLLDVHVAALERVLQAASAPSAVLVEARLVALEMMGLLVDYYRVGHRRRFVEGAKP